MLLHLLSPNNQRRTIIVLLVVVLAVLGGLGYRVSGTLQKLLVREDPPPPPPILVSETTIHLTEDFLKLSEDIHAATLMFYIRGEMGKFYKYGVFDCSFLTQSIYMNRYHVLNMPRTAREQLAFGIDIPLKEACTGDLIRFKGDKHVGIYISPNMVFHNSSSRGPSFDNISEGWLRESIVGAVKILERLPNVCHRE